MPVSPGRDAKGGRQAGSPLAEPPSAIGETTRQAIRRTTVMTAEPEQPSVPGPGGAVGNDPTRDIRLPPGGVAPALPAAWSRPAQAGLPPTDEPTDKEKPAASKVDERTDELPAPHSKHRNRTLAFSAPEMRHRPIEPVQVSRSPRRWPWFVLAALPVLVIVGTGVWLLLLLRGA